MQTERRIGHRWVWFALLVLVVSVVVIHTSQRVSYAQGEEAPAASGGDSGGGENKAPENFLVWVIRCSGLIGAGILLLSIYFVATVARLFMELRIIVAMPPEIVAQCEAMLEQRDFKGIFNIVKEDESYFSRVLMTGITELPNGLAEARDSMERIADMLTAEMDKKISMLAVLGTLGPMIGLLGTLKGMIGAFGEIARAGTSMKAGAVANNISEALLLTFEGVFLSVPSIFFFAFFRNRVSMISVTSLTRADEFLRHFAAAARAKPAPAGAAAPVRPKA